VIAELSPMPDDQPTRRFRFTLKQLFLAVALVAIGLGLWHHLFRQVVVVRVTTPADNLLGGESLRSRRHVAVVTGRLSEGTSISAVVYLVQSGLVTEGERHLARRFEKGKATETLRLGFFDTLARGGRATSYFFFASVHNSMTWDRDNLVRSIEHHFTTVAKQNVPGTITPGRPHIVYVEGDRQIVVDGSMSVEEFAKMNPGNYLLVTVEVR
jgi:hypothetical protein